MPYFQPDYTFASYRDVAPEALRAHGIEVLLLDIDNTLAPYEQPDPDEKITAWLSALAAAGIRTAFLSNNHEARVTRFNETLERPAVYDAGKPSARKGKKLMRALGGNKKNTAMMGDQVFTDVWTARALGVTAILVPPIRDKRNALTRFKRCLERGVLRRYHRRHPDAYDTREGSSIAKEFECL